MMDMNLGGGDLADAPGAARDVRIAECLPSLRAFARVLTRERYSADDLVRRTIRQGFERDRAPSAGLRLFLLTILHGLHRDDRLARPAGTVVDLPNSTRAAAVGTALPEWSSFQRAFWRLRDDDRKALILTGAAGLSPAEAASVCGCSAGTIALWVKQGRAALLRGRRQLAADRACGCAPARGVDTGGGAVGTA